MKEELYSLIENKHYKELKVILNDMNESDIAEFMEDVEDDNLIRIFRLINKDMAAEVFSYLPLTLETKIINKLKDNEIVDILEDMYTDDAVDLLEDMPTNVIIRLLKQCNNETRTNINRLLKYEDNTAGSIMTVEYAELKTDLTIERAISILKKEMEEYETINTCYVVDKKRKLVGKIYLKDLLFAKPNELVGDLCEDCFSVKTNTDQEEVANLFKKYDVSVMAVVDNENRLIGIITVDDIIDVIESETNEDIEKMAAIIPTDKPYFDTSVFETWKKRIPWLLLLMISATFTGKIISSFEDSLATIPVLTAFIPMLMDTGGNAGGQVSVTIIRGLSLDEIDLGDWLKAIWKELRVALLCGITLAFCNFFKLLIIDGVSTSIALVVCLTLIATVFIAKFVGCVLPLLAKKLKFDPAVMASPFITTIVDALSLLMYFKIAVYVLGL